MTLSFWMLLVAGLLPYATVGFAKFSARGYDNNHPRQWATGLEGRQARAHAAHQNHFEFFPFFAAAVIVAEMRAGGSAVIGGLAVLAVLSRFLYTFCYITDRATLRSLSWFLGILCVLGLFGVAAAGR
ncbi:MAG: hypothetical protein CTY25_13085 [Methylobacterium sp.]|nr:MAG: hypothetical protein CTY25_13085 [Methylobacterium sp.]